MSSKMTKAQARKRLKEAEEKIAKVAARYHEATGKKMAHYIKAMEGIDAMKRRL